MRALLYRGRRRRPSTRQLPAVRPFVVYAVGRAAVRREVAAR